LTDIIVVDVAEFTSVDAKFVDLWEVKNPHVSWRRQPVLISGDVFQVQQVFINLISNAYESALDGERQITIKCSKRETHLVICVLDDGPGIRKDVLPNVFEAFITTKPDALGIGLSVAQTIIEAHGGHIKADNRSEGGASISFTLPFVAGDDYRKSIK
jgi:signal transduction histidine kinase